MPRAKTKPVPFCLLTIEASFDQMPSDDELKEILDKIRETGGIDKAEFKYTRPGTRDLLKEL